MKFIATDVSDSLEKMADRLEESMAKRGRAINSYFYRSHLVYERELEKPDFLQLALCCPCVRSP